jgi:DNA-binding NtrC family response regulator
MGDDIGIACIVDDDPSICRALSNLLRSAGFGVRTFASAAEYLAAQRPNAPTCLVLDVQLPGLSGLDLQEELAKTDTRIPIIFLTGYGDIPMTVRAMKAGAIEFLTKPFKDEDLLRAIQHALNQDRRARQQRASLPVSTWEEVVGTSAALRRVLKQVETVAPTDSTVIIYGETGTGKELIARGIHNLSPRRPHAFVRLNCAAIPTGLLESELFGHEKGAFTGALARRIGRFEQATGGTIFLDEVGEIPLDLQTKLLRVLQEREFERLGSTQTLQTDVRVIAATNRDLSAMVEEQKYRADLFYRLNVFPIHLPPLRERPEDIPLLVQHFVDQFARRMHKVIDRIPPDTMEALTCYRWPGNIRELQNVIERAVILASGPDLRVSLGELAGRLTPAQGNGVHASLENLTRAHILATLKETNWVLSGPTGAAARLGLNRSTLQFRMKKLGIVRSAA